MVKEMSELMYTKQRDGVYTPETKWSRMVRRAKEFGHKIKVKVTSPTIAPMVKEFAIGCAVGLGIVAVVFAPIWVAILVGVSIASVAGTVMGWVAGIVTWVIVARLIGTISQYLFMSHLT